MSKVPAYSYLSIDLLKLTSNHRRWIINHSHFCIIGYTAISDMYNAGSFIYYNT